MPIPFAPAPYCSSAFTFAFSPSALSHSSPTPTTLHVRAHPNTDWWRAPTPSPADRRTGAVYAFEIDGARDFAAGVWIRGKWETQYDQACLFVEGGEGGDWVKAGVEMDGGREWVGHHPLLRLVVQPAAHSTSTLNPSPHALYIHITRKGPQLVIRHLLVPEPTSTPPALDEMDMIRKVKAFNVNVDGALKTKDGGKWRLGVMVCGPKNEKGTEAMFEGFEFEQL